MRRYVPKGSYGISKHRYLELLNYCKQYPEWKRALAACYDILPATPKGGRSAGVSDPTERAVERAERIRKKMELVEQAAIEADSALYRFIILNVTEGVSYEYLSIRGASPCCGRRQFYEKRRQFFWILSENKKG